MSLFLIVIALAITGAANDQASASSEVIETTIAHSEWGPYKALRLNMLTGEYELRSFSGKQADRSPRSTKRGKLSAPALDRLRPAYKGVIRHGIVDAACSRDPQRNELIVGNGGVPLMTLRSSGHLYQAARSFQCWTPEAQALDTALNETFTEAG